ncbi:hypothetical protein GCM10010378_11500 [Streptomyces viridochromogenes]
MISDYPMRATLKPSESSVPVGWVLIVTSVKARIGRPLSQLPVLAFGADRKRRTRVSGAHTQAKRSGTEPWDERKRDERGSVVAAARRPGAPPECPRTPGTTRR